MDSFARPRHAALYVVDVAERVVWCDHPDEAVTTLREAPRRLCGECGADLGPTRLAS